MPACGPTSQAIRGYEMRSSVRVRGMTRDTGEKDMILIGWQGISVRVPEDWTLAAVGGDRKSGYVRVDEESRPRFQVKWSQGHTDLTKRRDDYVKRLTLGRRKRPTGIEVDTEARFISQRSKPKKELVTLAWRGNECGMGLFWNCEVCNRALMAQVSWRPQEELHGIAREALASLDDHGVGGWEAWGVDGLAFLAPEDYELTKWKRLTRYLELSLQRGVERLKVARWGMVSLVLRGGTLPEWFAREQGARREVSWSVREAETKGHPGLSAEGRPRLAAIGLRRAAARAVRLGPALEFASRVWHCPPSNRMLMVESLHKQGSQVLDGVVDSIPCHEGA